MRSHARAACPQRLIDSFNLPSCCPSEDARWTTSSRWDAMSDAEEVEWRGGDRVVARYVCHCCGTRWSEDWPAILAFGPNYRRDHSPGRWVAGVNAPRVTSGENDALLAAIAAKGRLAE